MEIILIDDGSIDKSGEICDIYALSDNRIRVIHTKNKGPAAARNIGIENSKGECIFFLDSDDFIEKDALSFLMTGYKQNKTDIIIGDFINIKDDVVQKRRDNSYLRSKLLSKQELIDYSRSYLKKPNKYLLFAFSWGRLYKSSVIKNHNIFFDEKLYTFEDVAFNFECLKYVNTVFFEKKFIYNHRMYNNYSSATMALGNNYKRLFGFRQALDKIGIFLKDNINNADIKKEIGHAYVYLTIIQLVRACRQINDSNKKSIYELIRELVNDRSLRDNLKYYSPLKGDSKVIPFLVKLRLVYPIILVCNYKAQQRYGKGGYTK